MKQFIPSGFCSFSFLKANGDTRHAVARWFGDNLPSYYYIWRDDQIASGVRKPSGVSKRSTYGNVRFVDSALYNKALAELKRVNGIMILPAVGRKAYADTLRARAIDVSLRQFKIERLVDAPANAPFSN